MPTLALEIWRYIDSILWCSKPSCNITLYVWLFGYSYFSRSRVEPSNNQKRKGLQNTSFLLLTFLSVLKFRIEPQMKSIGVILGYFGIWVYNSDPSLLTWRLMPNGRIHRTCFCEKSAETQIRVIIVKQNSAHLDLAIAQEAYTWD